MNSHNPLLPRAVKVLYPDQYQGMEEKLLELRELIIHNGHWYQAKPTQDGFDAIPIPPETQIIEFKQRNEGSGLKLATPLPVAISSWAAILNNTNPDRHYKMLLQKEKYGKTLDQFIVNTIRVEPTIKMFGDSLQALGSFAKAELYWIEAGKGKSFQKYADEMHVPNDWKSDA
ncbi:hypothetical protein [Vibrio atypicus]|uniref:hypothetical protein n=1 Tax=Vibrio atypicus TaxID=558271 RepID=UPI003736B0CE